MQKMIMGNRHALASCHSECHSSSVISNIQNQSPEQGHGGVFWGLLKVDGPFNSTVMQY